jgi:hypothetical protein
MSAESDSSKQWRDPHINPNRRYADRFAANTLADQQVEAATRELRSVFEEVEDHPGDRRLAGNAIRSAWQVLMMVGFSDFDEMRRVNTEDWPSIIDPKQRALVSLALEIVGWYQFGLRPYDIDRTARIFDRALELTPHNQRALERFAIVANEIQPSHIGGLAKFPKKQSTTSFMMCSASLRRTSLDKRISRSRPYVKRSRIETENSFSQSWATSRALTWP